MTAGARATVTLFTALLVLLVVAATLVTPYVLLVAALWTLVWFCRRYARKHARPGRAGSGMRYHLCAVGVLYLVPISLAATFYGALAAYLRLFGDSIDAGRLAALQRRFEAVSGFFSERLKLSELWVLALLVGVHLLTCLLLAGRPRDVAGGRQRVASTLHRVTAFYTRFSGPVAAGLATLAAFTLFGMHLGVPADDLRLRLKVAQRGFAEVTRTIEADLNRQVAQQLYDKVYAALPVPYRDALNGEKAVGVLLDAVRAHAQQARSLHGVSVGSIDRAVAEETARQARAGAAPPELRLAADGRADLPPEATPQRVAAARAATRGSPQRGIELITDGRRTVTLQLEKVVSERIVALVKPLTDAVPILEPLLQAFAEAADTALQQRLGAAYDRLVGAALDGSPGLDAMVAEEARTIVERTDVTRAVSRAAPDAERVAANRRLLMSSLRAGSATIDRSVAETVARRAAARPRTPGDLRLEKIPPLKLPPLELPPSLRFPPYGTPELPGYRPPPRYLPPVRPVRPVRPPVRPPVVRIPFW
jgi:hypothetical protein